MIPRTTRSRRETRNTGKVLPMFLSGSQNPGLSNPAVRKKIDPDLVRIDKTGGGEVVINHRLVSLTAERTKIGETKTISSRTNEDGKSLRLEQHCLLPGPLPVL